MQGVPGSGKSTIAKILWQRHGLDQAAIVSADNFHTDRSGGYLYRPEDAGKAHAWCLRTFITFVTREEQVSLIIVDNTNTTVAEAAPYMAIASAYGCAARILHVDCDWEEAARRNVHGVPLKTVAQLYFNLKSFSGPSWWVREKYEANVG